MEARIARKRKAATQDHAELSKRLKRLNLDLKERDGQTLHIPIPPAPTSPPPKPHRLAQDLSLPPLSDDSMQLDNTKYKVYIHNIDDEISDSESDDGKIVFLPDIEKKIRNMRIPRSILTGEVNGRGEEAKDQQLVLYGIPSSLTVPEERDSVRKAIIEARARARGVAGLDGIRESRVDSGFLSGSAKATNNAGIHGLGVYGAGAGIATGITDTEAMTPEPAPLLSAEPPAGGIDGVADLMVEDDPDAMDLS